MNVYTPPEVGRMLRVKPDKVIRWIRAGELIASNLAERATGRPRWRITQEALDEFLRRRRAVSRANPVTRRRKREAEVTRYV
jgi:hypothetical protein